ncbi:MAG: hypothetical protein QXR17_08780 [Candidatus Bathyarchaeia archaeon]
MITWEIFGLWISTALVIWIYSFAFRDNMFYKLAENIFIGAAAGYSIALALDNLTRVFILPVSKSPNVSWHLAIPFLFGVLMFMKYSRKYYWLARYAVAINIGVGTGIAMRAAAVANISRQISATILPLWSPDPVTIINNWLLVIITLGGLVYFLFTIFPREITGTTRTSIRNILQYVYRALFVIGIYGMMVGFGALFANTIMSDMAQLFSMMSSYILTQPWVSIVATVLAVVAMVFSAFRSRQASI